MDTFSVAKAINARQTLRKYTHRRGKTMTKTIDINDKFAYKRDSITKIQSMLNSKKKKEQLDQRTLSLDKSKEYAN